MRLIQPTLLCTLLLAPVSFAADQHEELAGSVICGAPSHDDIDVRCGGGNPTPAPTPSYPTVVPPKAYAKAADRDVQVATGYGRVDELCPETTLTYRQKLDDFDNAIDVLSGAPWPHNMIAELLKQDRVSTELCAELRTLKEDYDLVFSSGIILTPENQQKVRVALNGLDQCLKDAKKRSEIENCSSSFRDYIRQLLGL